MYSGAPGSMSSSFRDLLSSRIEQRDTINAQQYRAVGKIESQLGEVNGGICSRKLVVSGPVV